MRVVFALALAASATAFVPPVSIPAARQSVTSLSAISTVEKSPALPMLPRPMKLKGWTGDVGFDPLGLSVRCAAARGHPKSAHSLFRLLANQLE